MNKVVIASDHAGFDLKKQLIDLLEKDGYDTADCGTYSRESCDYPIEAEKACRYMLEHGIDRCILICGTGVGMSLAANKIKGIRAACCSDTYTARYTRLHNDANVLCIGARVVGVGLAYELVKVFLNTDFEGGKHQRRIDEITAIENNR